MLQCQNYILADQVSTFQYIAEKTAVKVAQAKYRKWRGKGNKKRIHLAIAKAGVDWDPGYLGCRYLG